MRYGEAVPPRPFLLPQVPPDPLEGVILTRLPHSRVRPLLLASVVLAMLLIAGCSGALASGGAASEANSPTNMAPDTTFQDQQADGMSLQAATRRVVEMPRWRRPGTSWPRTTTTWPRTTTSWPRTTTSWPRTTTTWPRTTTTQPTPTTAPPGGGGGGGSTSTEREVLALVNAERAKAGCGALREDARLVRAARLHSQDMLARNYF